MFGSSLYDVPTFRGPGKRPADIDPNKRNLVLIVAGQSNRANTARSLYLPPHGDRIDALNIFDGALYSIVGPLPGATYEPALGPGNVAAYLAELLISEVKIRSSYPSYPWRLAARRPWIGHSGEFANPDSDRAGPAEGLEYQVRYARRDVCDGVGSGRDSKAFLQTPGAGYTAQPRDGHRHCKEERASLAGFFVSGAWKTRVLDKVWPLRTSCPARDRGITRRYSR